MNESLLHLYELQKIDTHLDELVDNRGELPDRVNDAKRGVEHQTDYLRQAKTHIDELEARSRNIQAESLDLREKVEKYKAQQFDVKTTREYDAITFQLEDGQKRLSKHIEDSSRIGLELEQTRIDTAHIAEDLEAMAKELAEQEASLKEMMAETAEEEAEYRKRRAETVKLVSKQHLAMYDRVRPAKNGLAVVPVRNGVCGGCFNAIPRQLVLELKLGEKNAVCEYCGRIVVGEPISLAVDGEPQPVAQVTGEPEEAEAEE